MKKFILVICSILFPIFLGGLSPAYASDLQKDIEHEDIETLIIDPAKVLPEDEIKPVPTPTPFKEPEKPAEDTRSWTKSPFVREIAAASKKYDLDPQIIYATIMTESEGNRYAFRYEPKIKDASLCLGQILISTARRLGFSGDPKNLYKPEVCIDLIGKYHRMMLDRYGSLTPVQLAIAYNAGSPHKRPVRGHLTRFKKWFAEEA